MTVRKTLLLLSGLTLAGLLAAQEDPKAPRPGDTGRGPGDLEFRAPQLEPPAIREEVPLQVSAFEIHELAEGTHVGEPGQLLLTLHGQGFMATSRSPSIEIGGGAMVLDDTLMDFAGTELYAVLATEAVSEIGRMDFREMVVSNPGDPEREGASVRVAAPKDRLLRPAEGAPRARLLFRDGEFVRELVRDEG